MSADQIIGRTIAAIEDHGYDGFEIVFTDGTRAVVVGHGYDDSAAGVDGFLDHEAIRRRAAERQGEREAARVGRLRQAVRQAEEDAQRAALSPHRFEAWMDRNRPGWRFKEIMTHSIRAAYSDMLWQSRRQVYGSEDVEFTGLRAIIPVADADR